MNPLDMAFMLVRCLRITFITNRRPTIFSAVILLLSVLLIGASGKKEAKLGKRAINVQLQTVATKSLRPFIEAIGTLKALEQVVVSSKIDGIQQTANAEEGMFVAKGSLLATVDDRDYASERRDPRSRG